MPLFIIILGLALVPAIMNARNAKHRGRNAVWAACYTILMGAGAFFLSIYLFALYVIITYPFDISLTKGSMDWLSMYMIGIIQNNPWLVLLPFVFEIAGLLGAFFVALRGPKAASTKPILVHTPYGPQYVWPQQAAYAAQQYPPALPYGPPPCYSQPVHVKPPPAGPPPSAQGPFTTQNPPQTAPLQNQDDKTGPNRL